MLLKKKLGKDTKQPNHFTTIDDLPVKIWFEIHKEGDLSLLIKHGSIEYLELVNIWESLYNEYLVKFGISETLKNRLETKKRIGLLQADYIITGQKHLRTLINIEKEKLEEDNKDIKEPVKLDSILAKMSKYYGFKLSSRDLTTTEYYSYLENITNG
jgi:hypothetical protein